MCRYCDTEQLFVSNDYFSLARITECGKKTHETYNLNIMKKIKMKKIKTQFRQGDVYIERIDALPKEVTHISCGKSVLAEGEATGHKHEIDAMAAEAWLRNGETIALRVTQPAKVRHQEHAPIPLKRGVYRVIRQKEYSPEEIRRVAD